MTLGLITFGTIDWIATILFILITVFTGIYFSKKARESKESFFLGGRTLPWYLAGLSMVATTFAADTPLAVTELVMKNGLSGNWVWWNFAIGGMFTAVFFARLWRRSEVITETELISLRYSGKQAVFLRRFKSVYLGFFINILIMGWVNQALFTILTIFFDLTPISAFWATAACMALVAIYSTYSGFLGIVYTDALQFIIAMGGCIVLAWFVVDSEQIGSISNLKSKLPEGALNFVPSFENSAGKTFKAMNTVEFILFTCFIWWASWYPGAEPGGGGYIAQRMLGTKDEKGATYATLFFQIVHYAIRPWPWIIVALGALILYPGSGKEGYVLAMKDYLPEGMRGIMLVAFLGAYMSTISTHLNWGASYLVNDLFIDIKGKKRDEKAIVLAGQFFTVLLMAVSLFISPYITSIESVWKFIMECGAGLGLVLMLRWYWWRINAWSEIVATITPFLVYGIIQIFRLYKEIECTQCTPSEIETLLHGVWWLNFPGSTFVTIGITTITWLTVTYLTRPTEDATLLSFYKKIKPQGWWKPQATLTGIPQKNKELAYLAVCWLFAVILTYATLFATGSIILQNLHDSTIYISVLLISISGFVYFSKKAKLFNG